MNYYQYKPIPGSSGDQKIRLIRLLPSKHQAAIRCRLIHVSLKKKPRYEAISYSWGDATVKVPIACDNARLDITADLHSALLRLRTASSSRTLWADAICINQSDIKERNHQVQIMRNIYENARRVLIWLGDEYDGSKKGMHLASQLAIAASGQLYRSYLDRPDSSGRNHPNFEKKFGLLRQLPGYPELNNILSRSWFSRVWVVQELAVSSNAMLYCGEYSLPWTDFFNAILLWDHINVFLPDSLHYQYVFMLCNAHFDFQSPRRSDLLKILCRHRRCLSTDPRDKIFALLGLSNDAGPDALDVTVDYDVDISTLYSQIAVKILQRYRSLDLLSMAALPTEHNPHNLPSWVPDWACAEIFPRGIVFGTYTGEELHFTATDSSKASPIFKKNQTLVGLYGNCFDVIDMVGFSLYASMKEDYFHSVFENWMIISGACAGGRYITGESAFDACMQTILAGGSRTGNFTEMELLKKWLLSLQTHTGESLGSVTLEGSARVVIKPVKQSGTSKKHTSDIMTSSVISKSLERAMIRTRKGYIGLAQTSAQPGDKIVLFKGGKVPLIIRPEGRHWRLIGDCYIQGIMHGEAFYEENCKLMWIV